MPRFVIKLVLVAIICELTAIVSVDSTGYLSSFKATQSYLIVCWLCEVQQAVVTLWIAPFVWIITCHFGCDWLLFKADIACGKLAADVLSVFYRHTNEYWIKYKVDFMSDSKWHDSCEEQFAQNRCSLYCVLAVLRKIVISLYDLIGTYLHCQWMAYRILTTIDQLSAITFWVLSDAFQFRSNLQRFPSSDGLSVAYYWHLQLAGQSVEQTTPEWDISASSSKQTQRGDWNNDQMSTRDVAFPAMLYMWKRYWVCINKKSFLSRSSLGEFYQFVLSIGSSIFVAWINFPMTRA